MHRVRLHSDEAAVPSDPIVTTKALQLFLVTQVGQQ